MTKSQKTHLMRISVYVYVNDCSIRYIKQFILPNTKAKHILCGDTVEPPFLEASPNKPKTGWRREMKATSQRDLLAGSSGILCAGAPAPAVGSPVGDAAFPSPLWDGLAICTAG